VKQGEAVGALGKVHWRQDTREADAILLGSTAVKVHVRNGEGIEDWTCLEVQ
jgi:hypothetical protein